MNILVHIDRLVLEGFELAPAQRRHLQAALQAELGDLLSSGGLRGEFASGIGSTVPATTRTISQLGGK